MQTSKGQTSIETLIIISVMLMLLLTLLASGQKAYWLVSDKLTHAQIKGSLVSVEEAGNIVFTSGTNSKIYVTITLPEGVSSSYVANRTIEFSTKGEKRTFLHLDYPVVGSLPTAPGDHTLTIESKGEYVLINNALFTVTPSSVLANLDKNQNLSQQITIKNVFNETIDLTLNPNSIPWQIILDNESFQLIPNQSKVITIWQYSNISYGKYIDFLPISATSVSGSNQRIRFPIYLDVEQVSIFYGTGDIEGTIGFIPGFWDFEEVIPNQEYSTSFILFSGLNVTRTINLSFNSSNDWHSFTPFSGGMNTTSQIILDSLGYETIDIYLKLNSTAQAKNYAAILKAVYEEGQTSANFYYERPTDISSPIVNNTNVTTKSITFGNYVCVSAEAYDDVGISSIELNYTDPSDNSFVITMNDTLSTNTTNVTCAENVSDNIYGTMLFIENQGDYTLVEVKAYDFENKTGSEYPNIIIKGSHNLYGTEPFDGTVMEEPNDICTDGGDTWLGSVVAISGDGLETDAHDDGHACGSGASSCCAGPICCSNNNCPCWEPDWVEFDFSDLGVPDVPITNVELTIKHRDDLTSQGQLNTQIEAHNKRHMIKCYNGDEWVDVESYELSLNASEYITYNNIDISTCVHNSSVANNMKIRMTFDPFDDTGSMLYVDYVSAVVDTSPAFSPDLWDMSSDLPMPVDFTSGLNSSANTFSLIAGNNDGWDWADQIYSEQILTDDFVLHNDPSNESDDFSSDNRIEIRIGGENSGTDEVIASGAWGVEFNITQEMYDVIKNDEGVAYFSMTFYVEDLYLTTDGLGMGGAWVKARISNEDQTNYLGTDLDNLGSGEPHYSDTTPELWAAVDITDPGWGSDAFGVGIVYRSYSEEITQYITSPGRYYLDFGGKASWESGSKADDEGLGIYFDNVRILIKY